MPKRQTKEKKVSANQVITREYTVNLHKRVYGLYVYQYPSSP